MRLPSRVDALSSIAVMRRDPTRIVHRAGMHAHEFYSLLFVDGGQGLLQLPRESVEIQPGDLHLSAPGEAHNTDKLGPVTGWIVEFTAEALGEAGAPGFFGVHLGRPRWEGLLGRRGLRLFRVPDEQRPAMAARLVSLHEEVTRRALGYQEGARAILRLLLLELLRQVVPATLAARLSPVVEEALAVIDERYAESLSLRHVASAVGRSPSYLTHVVRSELGLTVLECIVQRRLEEARRRLSQTDERIEIIGERVGFGSTNHFIRQFRAAHGLTPGAWRRSALPNR